MFNDFSWKSYTWKLVFLVNRVFGQKFTRNTFFLTAILHRGLRNCFFYALFPLSNIYFDCYFPFFYLDFYFPFLFGLSFPFSILTFISILFQFSFIFFQFFFSTFSFFIYLIAVTFWISFNVFPSASFFNLCDFDRR